MNKYLFKAEVTMDTESWTEERIVIEENEDFAEAEFVSKIREIGEVEIDDIRYEDLGPANVYINMRRDSYAPDGKSLTVKELIDILSQFDPDSKVVLRDYSGWVPTYGILTEWSVDEETMEEE